MCLAECMSYIEEPLNVGSFFYLIYLIWEAFILHEKYLTFIIST